MKKRQREHPMCGKIKFRKNGGPSLTKTMKSTCNASNTLRTSDGTFTGSRNRFDIPSTIAMKPN